MYTTIHHITDVERSIDEQAVAGREVALTLSKQAGFIAYLLIDLGSGTYSSICVFEDEARLRRARQEARRAAAEELSALLPEERAVAEGEVIVQKGL